VKRTKTLQLIILVVAPLEENRLSLKSRYFTAIVSYRVKTVVDGYRLAVYHNKHC